MRLLTGQTIGTASSALGQGKTLLLSHRRHHILLLGPRLHHLLLLLLDPRLHRILLRHGLPAAASATSATSSTMRRLWLACTRASVCCFVCWFPFSGAGRPSVYIGEVRRAVGICRKFCSSSASALQVGPALETIDKSCWSFDICNLLPRAAIRFADCCILNVLIIESE
jgi:hypothetical protein